MASMIIHICISNMVKEELNLSDKFLAGSIMPDLKKMAGFDRGITHYLKYVVENGNVMHLPDPFSYYHRVQLHLIFLIIHNFLF